MDDRLIFRYLFGRVHAGHTGLSELSCPFGDASVSDRRVVRASDGVTQEGSPTHALVDVG
jgi:hypothetical protein